MTEWGVYGVIASIVAFGVLVGAPLFKLSGILSELKTVLSALQKQFDKLCVDNEKEHNSMWDKTESQDKILGEHETRITVLEHSKEAL